MKQQLVERLPVLRDAGAFRTVRRILREDYGLEKLRSELQAEGFVEGQRLTTGTKPFNLFARIASGEMLQEGMEQEQAALQDFSQLFCICKNRPENDEHWASEEPQWLGKASMSARHRFLTTKDLRWTFFNALTMGMEGQRSLVEAIRLLEDLQAAASTYVATVGGWSDSLGLFFHVYGHNSVNSLHLHLVDLKALGPTFSKLDYKNCPLSSVLEVLREELLAASPRAMDALVELNVGGTVVTVSATTLALLPTVVCGQRDGQGRLFVDVPFKVAQPLLDAARLRALQGGTGPLRLSYVDRDTRAVARALGLEVSQRRSYAALAIGALLFTAWAWWMRRAV